MTPLEVWHAVMQAGGHLTPHGDNVIVEASAPLAADLIMLVRQHKPALLALLRNDLCEPLSEGPVYTSALQPVTVPKMRPVDQEPEPTQYWSDVLHERFWVAPTPAHTAALAAQGQVAYQPEEIWRLRELKARDPHAFSAQLCAIHQAKTIFGATVFALEHQAKTE
jgi:hypothetical protein